MNAWSPILVIVLGSSIFVRFLQLKKAAFLILVTQKVLLLCETEEGMVIEVKFEYV